MSTSNEGASHTRVDHPERVTPEELDHYLARGWYRIGQAMVTCRFVWSQDRSLRSAIWTRTPIDEHRPSRSQRRLMRKNADRYRVFEGPLRPDGEHEALYRRYLKVAQGERPSRLVDALLGGHVHDRFDTREIAIRNAEGDLVAFSAFDVGRRSLQSLMGVYDPEYSSDSLGFWTLLLEVEHARELGLRFHYSGYVLPGDASMDYKLRVSPVQFLHPDRDVWAPWDQFTEVDLPVLRLERRLAQARDELVAQGFPARVESYHPYEAPAWNPGLERALGHPRVVLLEPPSAAPLLNIVAWSIDDEEYRLLRCVRAAARGEPRGDEPPRTIELWVVAERRDLGGDPSDAARRARSILEASGRATPRV